MTRRFPEFEVLPRLAKIWDGKGMLRRFVVWYAGGFDDFLE